MAGDAPSGGIYGVAENWKPEQPKKKTERKRSGVDVYETEDDRRKREERDANDEKKRERKERGAKIKSRREEKRAAKIEWRRGEREKREKFEADDLAAIVEDWRVGRERKLNPSGPQPTAFQRFLNETFDEAPTNAKAGKIRSTFEARREKARSERRESHSAWRDMRSGKGPSWIGVDDFSYGRIGKKIAGNRKGGALGKIGGSALGKIGKALTTVFAPVKSSSARFKSLARRSAASLRESWGPFRSSASSPGFWDVSRRSAGRSGRSSASLRARSNFSGKRRRIWKSFCTKDFRC